MALTISTNDQEHIHSPRQSSTLPLHTMKAPSLYRLVFEDRVSSHLNMEAKTSDGCHVIDTAFTTQVADITVRWKEMLVGANYHMSQEGKVVLREAVFQISPTCAVSVASQHIDWGCYCMILSRTSEEALKTYALMAEHFGVPKNKVNPEKPKFKILVIEAREIVSYTVPLESYPTLTLEEMDLSYGSGFYNWAKNLGIVFLNQSNSLTLLQGPPGTGKTSFLRWLIANNHNDIDFYFVPVTCIGLLSNQTMTSFWLREFRYSTKPKVLLIEDAEFILMKRGPDNSQWVGNLLNITDGIMGDALKFHLVCSINCPFTDIDPALLRAGRLTASWTFNSLSHENAAKLSTLIGKPVVKKKDRITLAEIYGAVIQGTSTSPQTVGFGAG